MTNDYVETAEELKKARESGAIVVYDPRTQSSKVVSAGTGGGLNVKTVDAAAQQAALNQLGLKAHKEKETLINQKTDLENKITERGSELTQAGDKLRQAESNINKIENELSKANPNEKRTLRIGGVTYTERVDKLRERLSDERAKLEENKVRVREGWQNLRQAQAESVVLSGQIQELVRLEKNERENLPPTLSVPQSEVNAWSKRQTDAAVSNPLLVLARGYEEKVGGPLKRALNVEQKNLNIGYTREQQRGALGLFTFGKEALKGGVAGIIDLPKTILSIPSFIGRTGGKFAEGEEAYNKYVSEQLDVFKTSFVENPAYFAGAFISPIALSKAIGAASKVTKAARGTAAEEVRILNVQVEPLKFVGSKERVGIVRATGFIGEKKFSYAAPFESVEVKAVGGGTKLETTVTGGFLNVQDRGLIRVGGSEGVGMGFKTRVRIASEEATGRILDTPEKIIVEPDIATIKVDTNLRNLGKGFITSEDGGLYYSFTSKPIRTLSEGLPIEVSKGIGRVKGVDWESTFVLEDVSTIIDLKTAPKTPKITRSGGVSSNRGWEAATKELSKTDDVIVVDVASPIRKATQDLTGTGSKGIFDYSTTGNVAAGLSVPREYQGVYDIPQDAIGYKFGSGMKVKELPNLVLKSPTISITGFKAFQPSRTGLKDDVILSPRELQGFQSNVRFGQLSGQKYDLALAELTGTRTTTDLQLTNVSIPNLTLSGFSVKPPKFDFGGAGIKKSERETKRIQSGFQRRTRSVLGASLGLKPIKKRLFTGLEIR